MNKKTPKTNPPKPLDSPKLQEIRAGPDLKLQEGKGEREKHRKPEETATWWGSERVQALRTLDNLSNNWSQFQNLNDYKNNPKKSFPCSSVFRNEHPFPVSNVKSQWVHSRDSVTSTPARSSSYSMSLEVKLNGPIYCKKDGRHPSFASLVAQSRAAGTQVLLRARD